MAADVPPAISSQARNVLRGCKLQLTKQGNMKKTSARHAALLAGAAMVAAGLCAPAHADRFGLRVDAGAADHHIQKAELGLTWDPDITWWDTGEWHFKLLGEANVAYWRTHRGDRHGLYEFGLTPIVRYMKKSGSVRPFIEAGIGLRLLSHTSIGSVNVSTAFQFSDMIGAGAQFGARQQYEAGLRFQHISNAGIKEPNPGVNFGQLYFLVYF